MSKQHDNDTGSRYWHRSPAPELSGLVTGIHAYEEHGHAMAGVTETASLTVPLIINFGAPFHIGLGREPTARDKYASFAAGLYAGPVVMDSCGDAQCIQVNFTPIGGRLFFGVPMHELADCMVPLADLGDREIDALRARLGELNAWDARLNLVETFVGARLARAGAVDPALSWAFGRLAQSGGNIRIKALTERLEWSRRRLVEHFRQEFGLPPKAIARIIRFNAAEAMARASSSPDWADIAFACGYADQAHLTREFSELAGRTPTRWRAAA